MPKHSRQTSEEDSDEPLVDQTVKLQLHSKKLDRQRRKQQKKQAEKSAQKATGHILDLPYELLLKILEETRPSDVFVLARTCRFLQDFINSEEASIAKLIIKRRYVAIAKCFQLPVLLSNVDPSLHPALQDPQRQEIANLKKKPYQHIQSPDETRLCTCMTCLLRWNGLNLILDFAYWQDNLDKGEPIPVIARGKHPEWNTLLTTDNARIVTSALTHPLVHARLCEIHLASMVRSISRQAANKGNRRSRYRMVPGDAASGTDLFLERSGPPSLELPYHRDLYYLLETYMPNRGWKAGELRWVYVQGDESHERDVAWAVRVKTWRSQQRARVEAVGS